MKKFVFASLIILIISACSKKINNMQERGIVVEDSSLVTGYTSKPVPKKISKRSFLNGGFNPSLAYPNATIFRMNGDYANNVAVTLSPEGELLYFPSPTDITADSKPVELTDGWWLNSQGIGPNSVFTRYTFKEYASLPETPSTDQIKLMIIPGARVIDFMELPMKISEAQNNINSVNEYIKEQVSR